MSQTNAPYDPSRSTYPTPREWVFSLIYQHRSMTKAELVDKTGLSQTTIERALSDLKEVEKIESAWDPTEPRRKLFSAHI